MSQRNFPPSFWDSHYQPPPSSLAGTSYQDLPGFTTDPYCHMASSFHSMSSLSQDPWRYPFTSSQAHSYSTHGMHDLAYSAVPGTSRFNPAAHYGALLPGSRFGGQCDAFNKHVATDTWNSRYPDPLASSLTSHHESALHSGLSGK